MFNSFEFLNTVGLLFVFFYEVGKIFSLFIKVFQKKNCKLTNVYMIKVKQIYSSNYEAKIEINILEFVLRS